MATWQRLEKWHSDKAGNLVDMEKFVEVTVEETVFYERSGTQTRDRTTSKDLETADAAVAHLRGRVDRLLRAGWVDDGPLERYVPMRGAEKKAAKKKADPWAAVLADLQTGFEARLRDDGIDPGATFMSQTPPEGDWNALAAKCLTIAEDVFGVEFARAHFDDVEHMTDGWPLANDLYGEFYVSPKRVAQIAARHLRGTLSESDGRFPKSDGRG